MPLVDPLPAGTNEDIRKLSLLFQETLGFTPNSVLTMQRRSARLKGLRWILGWLLQLYRIVLMRKSAKDFTNIGTMERSSKFLVSYQFLVF